MGILLPSKVETIDYGQQFWHHIFNSNAQKINKYFNLIRGLWDGTATNGQTLIWDSTLGYWKPAAAPYPVPQAAVALVIGTAADTTVNTTLSKFFTLSLTKATNVVFTNFSTGMVLDLVTTQNSTGGFLMTFTGCTVIGEQNTDPLMSTWFRCFKVGTTTMVNIMATFSV